MEQCICLCPILDTTSSDATFNTCRICHKEIPNAIYPTDITSDHNTFAVNYINSVCPTCGK